MTQTKNCLHDGYSQKNARINSETRLISLDRELSLIKSNFIVYSPKQDARRKILFQRQTAEHKRHTSPRWIESYQQSGVCRCMLHFEVPSQTNNWHKFRISCWYIYIYIYIYITYMFAFIQILWRRRARFQPGITRDYTRRYSFLALSLALCLRHGFV